LLKYLNRSFNKQ